MKRTLCILTVFCLLAGCSSFPQRGAEAKDKTIAFDLDDPYQDGAIQIRVVGLERGMANTTGVEVEIRNNTDAVATVKWSKSTVTQSKRTSFPFLRGMPYNDAERPPPDERILSGKSSRRIVIPSRNIVNTGEDRWRVEALYREPVEMRISVVVAGKERDYGITVDPSGKK